MGALLHRQLYLKGFTKAQESAERWAKEGAPSSLFRRMLAPTMGDYELVQLPKSLFPLYWVIRPFRMAVQYGPRLFRDSTNSPNA